MRLSKCPACGCPWWERVPTSFSGPKKIVHHADGEWTSGVEKEEITFTCPACHWNYAVSTRYGRDIASTLQQDLFDLLTSSISSDLLKYILFPPEGIKLEQIFLDENKDTLKVSLKLSQRNVQNADVCDSEGEALRS